MCRGLWAGAVVSNGRGRATESKPSDILTDVRLYPPQSGKTEKRALNKRAFCKLSVQCPQPCSLQPKKGSNHCLNIGKWVFFWLKKKKKEERKTTKCGGWIVTFPSLTIALVTQIKSLSVPSTSSYPNLPKLQTNC